MTEHTHWWPADAEKLGRQRRADCGRLVQASSFSLTPSCPDCSASMAEDAALLQQIENNPNWGKAEQN